MKRLSLFMFTLMLIGSVVCAQGQEGRRGSESINSKQRADRMTERMVKELSLNDTQKKQLLELNQDWVTKMIASNQQGKKQDNDSTETSKKKREETPKMTKEQREKMMQEANTVRQEYETQLQKILTTAQYEAYKKQQAERMQQQRQRQRGGGSQ